MIIIAGVSEAVVKRALRGTPGAVIIIEADDDSPDPTDEPKPDSRRSRITPRGGRSDDWKGRKYGCTR